VAVLDRTRPRRTFRRIAGDLLAALLSPGDPTRDAPQEETHGGRRDAGDGATHPEATGESPRHTATNPQTQRHPEEDARRATETERDAGGRRDGTTDLWDRDRVRDHLRLGRASGR
jgi:hypothetical protein